MLIKASDKYDTVVQVIVGEGDGAKTFEVYKGMLSYYSDYFRSALKGDFQEAKEGVLRLPTEDPETFRYFKNWLYTRNFQSSAEPDWKVLGDEACVKLYFFADCRQIPSLGNAALDLLRQSIRMKWQIPTDLVEMIDEETMPGCGLRRFIVDIMARLWDGSSEHHIKMGWPKAALHDLAVRLISRPKKEDKAAFIKWDMCLYHIHQEGVRCEQS